MLVTDDKHPGDLLQGGHIDYIIRKAIAAGVDPVVAVRMGTLVPCQYFGLAHSGAVAPGYTADLIVLSDLEQFYPDRMASRILGMGDILSLIDKVQAEVDEEKARDMERKLRKADFDFNDFLDQFAQLRKMGNIGDLMGMIPGMGSKMKGMEMPDDKSIKRIESIILSMTAQERSHPDIINPSRKRRIAAGAGVEVAEVNRLMKQFDQSKKMMKQMSGMMGKKSKRGLFNLPF